MAQPLAQAAIIYQEIPVDEQIFLSGQRAFDFDGNGATDLTFSAVSPNFQLLTVTAGPIGFILLERTFAIQAAVLGEGATVSSAEPYKTAGPDTPALISQFFDNGNGPVLRGAWAGQSGYLGFNFHNQESGSRTYGWLEMEENGGWLRLKSWAYESRDNTLLLAGQIPEPHRR